MEKQSRNICQSFGLTQQEMATILGVKRGQLSMYECGKRSLPVHALQTLATMEQHRELAPKAKATAPSGKSIDEMQRTFAALFADNALRQMKLERKLAKEQKRQAAESASIQISELLSGDKMMLNKGADFVKEILSNKVSKTLAKSRLASSELDEIQMAVLKFEEKLLLSKMQGLDHGIAIKS